MALYEFECDKCEVCFDSDGSMHKPPRRRKCPFCGKFCPRLISFPTFKVVGKVPKWDKSDAKRMYNEMIDDSKQRLKTTPSPYSNFEFNPKDAEKVGARRLSDIEVSKKIETCTRQTKQALEVKKRVKK
jgi:putative FmdB family regulatory protein